MKPEDQVAFEDACEGFGYKPTFKRMIMWQAALDHRDAQPAVAVNEQMQRDAARLEYLEQFTKCIKTPNGDLAWTIQLQKVLVGDTFGKAVDAAIEAAKKGGV